jgi:hypothetical protein
MAPYQPFEIPQQLRELAERNVEQARAAYGQFMDAIAQATDGQRSSTQKGPHKVRPLTRLLLHSEAMSTRSPSRTL